MKVIKKILFCFKITADLPSFLRLMINSKKLSRSKSRKIPANKENTYFPLNIKFKGLRETIFLRTYKGDIEIFYEIFYKRIYSLPSTKGDIKSIIDLGANIGLSALYFKALYPNAHIICVEPGKDNYAMLLKNVGVNKTNGRIMAVNAAIQGSDGMVSFEDGKMHFNGKVTQSGLKDTVATSMATLFHFYQIEKAQLVKIDIEGSEEEIFSANVDWLETVDNIIIEMHSEIIRDKCQEVLNKNGFTLKQIFTDPDNDNLFWAFKTGSRLPYTSDM